MAAQAEGLAAALDRGFEAKVARPGLLRALLPAGPAPAPSGRGPEAALAPPWPDLLISCGRRSARLSVAVRRASGGATFTVHIQDPRLSPRRFDLVLAPRHDGLAGPNVFATRGALHRITRAGLEAAARRWRERLGPLRAAVLVGGARRRRGVDRAAVERLAAGLARVEGAVAVTGSRRTDPEALAILRARLPHARFWDGAAGADPAENPYSGMLALARHIVVTADSVSMTSEAAATGKPVHVAALGPVGKRVARFHALLRAEGVTRPFDGALPSWTYEPVDDAPRAAAEVLRRMAARDQRNSMDSIS